MSRRALTAAVLLLALVFGAGCSSGDDSVAVGDGTENPTDAEPATPTAAPEAAAVAPTSAPDEAAPEPTDVPEPTAAPATRSAREVLVERGAAKIALNDAESGPHPLLSWEPVSDASSYWLVVRDGDGRAYWAWTGAETEVRVGGGDRPELNQTAVVFEPMEWSVAAFDAEGELLAISDPAPVTP